MADLKVYVFSKDASYASKIQPAFSFNSLIAAPIDKPTIFYSSFNCSELLRHQYPQLTVDFQRPAVQIFQRYPVIFIQKLDQLSNVREFEEFYAALNVAKSQKQAVIGQEVQFVLIFKISSDENIAKLQKTVSLIKRIVLQQQNQENSVSSFSEALPTVELHPEEVRATQLDLLRQLQDAQKLCQNVKNMKFPATNESMTQVSEEDEKMVANSSQTEMGREKQLSSLIRPDFEKNANQQQNDDIDLILTEDVDSRQQRDYDEILSKNLEIQKQLQRKVKNVEVQQVQTVENINSEDVMKNSQIEKEISSISVEKEQDNDRGDEQDSRCLQRDEQKAELQPRQNAHVRKVDTVLCSNDVSPILRQQARPAVQQCLQNEQEGNAGQASEQRASQQNAEPGKSQRQDQTQQCAQSKDEVFIASQQQQKRPAPKASIQLLKQQLEEMETKPLDQQFSNEGIFEQYQQFSKQINQLAAEKLKLIKNSDSEDIHFEKQTLPQRISERQFSEVNFEFKTKDVNPKYLVYLVEVEQLLKRHKIMYDKEYPKIMPYIQPYYAQRISSLPIIQKSSYLLDNTYEEAYYRYHSTKMENQQLHSDEEIAIDRLNKLNSYLEDQVANRESMLSSKDLESQNEQRDQQLIRQQQTQTQEFTEKAQSNKETATADQDQKNNQLNKQIAGKMVNEVESIQQQIKNIKSQVTDIHFSLIEEMKGNRSGPSLIDRAQDVKMNIYDIRSMQ